MISSETAINYVQRLAAGAPTPGGGAAAGLHAAQAAALVSMVAEFTSRLRYEAVREQAQQIAMQKSQCIAAIQDATNAAAAPLAATVEASIEVIELAQKLLPIGNR